MNLFAGLMSGTSLDGVDAVLAEWPSTDPNDTAGEEAQDGQDRPARPLDPARPEARAAAAAKPVCRAYVHRPMPAGLRAELLALNSEGPNELHRAALAGNALAELYAETLHALLRQAGLPAAGVRAIGAHGQTVRHRPQAFGGTGYTLQLLNGALLAERTGIDVVCDFRSRDLAAGGQGAPLVPAFHAEAFGGAADVAVLNLGGIANLTLVPAQSAGAMVRGFDCGPGNMLMDLWCERHFGQSFDAGGALAATGQVDARLLRRLLDEPFLALAPPKSTGRDLFDARWLDARLAAHGVPLPAADVLATLAEFTAAAACAALARHAPGTHEMLVCGGGARNGHLMHRLAALATPGTAVASTAARGVDPEQVEAFAFAWLARAFCERRPGNRVEVTGARGARMLGALYPA